MYEPQSLSILLLIERQVLLGVFSWAARSATEYWPHSNDFATDCYYSARL